MSKLKSKFLELYRNYNLANSFRRIVRFWKDRSWQVSSAAAKEMGLKISNPAQPSGATIRRNHPAQSKGQSGFSIIFFSNTTKTRCT